VKIKAKTAQWARSYNSVLRKYISQNSGANLEQARKLGLAAVGLGLETLDVARVHEHALKAGESRGGISMKGKETIKRAHGFFAETVVPIEKTHPAALKADIRVNQLARRLRRRTVESSASTRNLKLGIARRQVSERALKTSSREHARLLAEAHRLQRHLRHLTHEILSAQEHSRKNDSRQLYDEIAQTLLAIHIRLLTLKKASNDNTSSLQKEIAKTRRLVKESTTRLQKNRFMRS